MLWPSDALPVTDCYSRCCLFEPALTLAHVQVYLSIQLNMTWAEIFANPPVSKHGLQLLQEIAASELTAMYIS